MSYILEIIHITTNNCTITVPLMLRICDMLEHVSMFKTRRRNDVEKTTFFNKKYEIENEMKEIS